MSNIYKRPLFLLLLLVLLGTFLRFYNLNWGAPFYFHPDERNIASSIIGLQFPNQLNPHFFAYGSLPIYTAYFLGQAFSFFSSCHFSLTDCHLMFEQAIIILRLISATFSVLIIPLTYIVGERLKKGAGLLAAAISCFSIGYIQFAHFGTVETLLTFFSLLLFLILLKSLKRTKVTDTLLIGIILGILVSVKISSVVLFILPLITFLLSPHLSHKKRFLSSILRATFVVLLASLVYFLTNPYTLLDAVAFQGSMNYEGGVVLGTLPVFYIGEFFGTIPGIFQFTSIYPFLLNPIITVFFIFTFFILCYSVIKSKDKESLLLLIFFGVLFIPQAILFAKWTRYMLPTLPFIYLILSIVFMRLQKYKTLLISLLLISTIVFGISYFMTAFVEKSTPLAAADFVKKNVPSDSKVISEVYDLGIVPFNQYLPFIKLYDFYELDNRNPEFTDQTTRATMNDADYLILPSQRILKTRILRQDNFPIGHKIYSDLLQNRLGMKKIYESPCSIFCQITYLGDPVFHYETTASVFERPVVIIYKKE